MLQETRPPSCFRGFRRHPSSFPSDALARAAVEAGLLAGYAEGHLHGLPASLPALRTKVEGLAVRVEDAMPTSHERFLDVRPALQTCLVAAQHAWICGVAPASIASAAQLATRVKDLAAALVNLHAVLDQANASVEPR